MGSQSDWETMVNAADTLKKLETEMAAVMQAPEMALRMRELGGTPDRRTAADQVAAKARESGARIELRRLPHLGHLTMVGPS